MLQELEKKFKRLDGVGVRDEFAELVERMPPLVRWFFEEGDLGRGLEGESGGMGQGEGVGEGGEGGVGVA